MGEKIGPVYEDNELGLFVRDLSNGIIENGYLQSISKRNNSIKNGDGRDQTCILI